VIGDLTIDQVLGIAREVVTLQRKMSNARSALDRVNDRVITAQEQARKVEKTINALES
jgi:predicted translin family RNA/ssDNA-binding protein